MITSENDQKLHNLTIEKDATTVVPDGAKLIITGECKNNGSLLVKGIVEFGNYTGAEDGSDKLYIINQVAGEDKRKTFNTTNGQKIGTLYVAGNVDLVLNGAVSVTKFETNAGDTNFIADDFTVNIGGTGSLSTTSMDFTRASSTDGVIGTYKLNVPVTCSGKTVLHSGSKVYINEESSFTQIEYQGTDSPKPYLEINAKVSSDIVTTGIMETVVTQNGNLEVGTLSSNALLSNSGTISVETAFTATNYLRPTDSTSDVVKIKEGATLSIINAATISNLNVVKTESPTNDFATISTTGTLDVTNATYNIGDIQTNGIISLPDTTEDNKIGSLKIESGKLTIDKLHVNSLNVVAGTIESATVNVTGDITNNGISDSVNIDELNILDSSLVVIYRLQISINVSF